MSTPPIRNAVFMQWWMSPASISDSHDAPARAIKSALQEFLGQAADDRSARPVGHAVDPDDETPGRKAAEMVVALDQQHLGSEPRARDGRRDPSRSAAYDEHV